MSIALIPGSFDPMTLGHLDIVKRALTLYDEVVVAVMVNDQKTYTYSLAERAEIARLTVRELPRVRVVASEGLLIDLFDALGADVIVKGVRNERDRAYEHEMAEWNIAHNPRAKTVFLQAADDYEAVSSSEVRAQLKAGKTPTELVAPAVIAYWQEKEGKA